MKLRKSAALVAIGLFVLPITLGGAFDGTLGGPLSGPFGDLPIHAGAPVAAASVATANLNVIELFTSQSCNACPPAEALLGELKQRPDLLALAFHVDYWNDLVYGAAGRWTDVHSDPAYTARQRGYAGHLDSRFGAGVYTPQVVIDGRTEAVGSNRHEIESAIAAARTAPRLSLVLATTSEGKTELRVSGAAGVPATSGDILLVRYREREETKIRAGENRGLNLANHRIVTGLTRLGGWVADAPSTILDGLSHAADGGCAVLIQAPDQGPILGAARCPTDPAKAS